MVNMLCHTKRKGKKTLAHFMFLDVLMQTRSNWHILSCSWFQEHVEPNNLKIISKSLMELAYNAFQAKRSSLMNTIWYSIVIIWPQQLNVVIHKTYLSKVQSILASQNSESLTLIFTLADSVRVSLPSNSWSELFPFSHANERKPFF